MIPVQNIYYMLSYAFQVLNEKGYKDIATEQFDNVAELCAAILSKGITVQLKRGLGKEYIPQTEALSSLRGKIDITESIKTQSLLRKQLICIYDDFTVNSYLNRILKTTMVLLHADVSKVRKKAIRKLMIYFADVDVLVDGPYLSHERSLDLLYRGSRNQRLIDMPRTLACGQVCLYTPPAW